MARTDNEQLRREIDNLLRELRHSSDCLTDMRQRLEKLVKLSDWANRGAKYKSEQPLRADVARD